MRWAIVASETRNARATWAVVRPPTARRVKAIAEAAVNAGWQHMNRTIRVSSSSAAGVDAGRRLILRHRGQRLATPAGLLAALEVDEPETRGP